MLNPFASDVKHQVKTPRPLSAGTSQRLQTPRSGLHWGGVGQGRPEEQPWQEVTDVGEGFPYPDLNAIDSCLCPGNIRKLS